MITFTAKASTLNRTITKEETVIFKKYNYTLKEIDNYLNIRTSWSPMGQFILQNTKKEFEDGGKYIKGAVSYDTRNILIHLVPQLKTVFTHYPNASETMIYIMPSKIIDNKNSSTNAFDIYKNSKEVFFKSIESTFLEIYKRNPNFNLGSMMQVLENQMDKTINFYFGIDSATLTNMKIKQQEERIPRDKRISIGLLTTQKKEKKI